MEPPPPDFSPAHRSPLDVAPNVNKRRYNWGGKLNSLPSSTSFSKPACGWTMVRRHNQLTCSNFGSVEARGTAMGETPRCGQMSLVPVETQDVNPTRDRSSARFNDQRNTKLCSRPDIAIDRARSSLPAVGSTYTHPGCLSTEPHWTNVYMAEESTPR